MVPGLHKMVDFDVSHSILCYQFTLHFLGLRFHFCAMPSKRLQPFVRHLCHRHPLQWITQFQISSVWQLLVPPLYPIESIFSRLSYRMEATGWIGQCLHCHAFSYLMRPRLDEPFSSWASFGSDNTGDCCIVGETWWKSSLWFYCFRLSLVGSLCRDPILFPFRLGSLWLDQLVVTMVETFCHQWSRAPHWSTAMAGLPYGNAVGEMRYLGTGYLSICQLPITVYATCCYGALEAN